MKRARVVWIGIFVVAAVAGAGLFAQRFIAPGAGAAGNPAAQQQQRPIPVTAGIAERGEFPIYRIGLGTVQAYNTVTVRARVDGEIRNIAFREGQDVQAGELLAEIDPRTYQAQLQQAEADKARDLASLTNAELDLERFNSLATREFASRQSVDTQKAQVAQLKAAVQRDAAAIDNASVLLGYTTIRAPIGGRVGIRLIDQGNIVHAGDSGGLVVITQLNPISVIFTLPQRNLPDVIDAMRDGALAVFAYDQENRLRLGEGQLELIDNQIDQTTGSVRLKASFKNDDYKLWPGEFVNAWLRLRIRTGPVVPDSVVQSGPDGPYAFAIRDDNSVEIRPLKVAASHQGRSLIEAGLKPGDRVVVDGQYRIRPGLHVIDLAQAKSQAANPSKPERALTE
jgi:multidrug efflux system membrane fusion protein